MLLCADKSGRDKYSFVLGTNNPMAAHARSSLDSSYTAL